MKRNYIKPTVENVEFGAGEDLALTIQVGSGSTTITTDQMESNRDDWEDDWEDYEE